MSEAGSRLTMVDDVPDTGSRSPASPPLSVLDASRQFYANPMPIPGKQKGPRLPETPCDLRFPIGGGGGI